MTIERLKKINDLLTDALRTLRNVTPTDRQTLTEVCEAVKLIDNSRHILSIELNQ